jgi:hypothetical protein
MAQRKPHLFERLTNLQELDRAWSAVLAHYPKDLVPQELRAFDRKRNGEIQRLPLHCEVVFSFLNPPRSFSFPSPIILRSAALSL